MCVVCFLRMRSTPRGTRRGRRTLGWSTCISLFCRWRWMDAFFLQLLRVSLSLPPPPFSFFNFSSLCPLLNSWLIALHWHAADGNVSGGQAAVVRREFIVESAMSLTLNRLSCNSCMKSPRGPDHPVDFSPIKAIRIFVHQLTNKKPTEADYVAGVLQGGFNRGLLSRKQFD